jgi:hypothetical protein
MGNCAARLYSGAGSVFIRWLHPVSFRIRGGENQMESTITHNAFKATADPSRGTIQIHLGSVLT